MLKVLTNHKFCIVILHEMGTVCISIYVSTGSEEFFACETLACAYCIDVTLLGQAQWNGECLGMLKWQQGLP